MFLYAIVDSALILLIPLHTDTAFAAGLIVTFIGISTVVTSPLVGHGITRTSTEFVLLIATMLRTVALLVILLDSTSTALWLIVALAYGSTVVGTQIPVNHYLSKYIPSGNRGRSASMINGMRRFGSCIGPLFAGHIRDFHVSVLITMAISLQSITVICCLLTPSNIPARPMYDVDGETRLAADGSLRYFKHSMQSFNVHRLNLLNWIRNSNDHKGRETERRLGMAYVWRKYLKLLLVVSVLSFGLNWVRITRKLILTFHGVDLGLSHGEIGSVNSISFVPDTLMFPIAGYLMDRYGRKATAVPGLILFIIALSTLPLTRDFAGLVAVAFVFGIADGITAGLLMTVAADIAPAECKSDFLAGFRIFGNMPKVVGPVVIGTLCTKVSLPSAAISSAGIGGVTLLWTIFVLDDPKSHGQRSNMMKEEMMLSGLSSDDLDSAHNGVTLQLPESLDAVQDHEENDNFATQKMTD